MTATKGRPRKFSTEEMIEIIRLYIQKNKKKPIRLTASKLATYSSEELGKKAHYQDFTRNEEVKKFIEDFNKSLIQSVTKLSDTFEVPVYEKLNVEKFLRKNNTKDKLEKALLRLDLLRERVHDSYGELQDRYVSEMEKKHEIEAKVKQAEKKVNELEKEKNEEIKEWKQKLKTVNEKNRTLRAKNKILQTFLKQHFYETISVYSLYLEGLITSGVEIENPDMIRVEDYKSGNYDLSDVIKSYNAITENIYVDSKDEEDYDDEYPEIEQETGDEVDYFSDEEIEHVLNPNENKLSIHKKLEDEIFGSNK